MAPLAWSIVVAWLVGLLVALRMFWRATDAATRRNVLQLIALIVVASLALGSLAWALRVLTPP